MSCFYPSVRIVVGKTKKGAVITVCVNCSAYSIPHFNYISKKQEVTFSLLSAKFVDTFENIELEDRTDTEEFLNKTVDIKEIESLKQTIKRLNKKFFKEQRKRVKELAGNIATCNELEKYISVDIADIEADMTYWELIIKTWNRNNKNKTPKNLCKPYYRNFIEYIDSACFGIEKHLEGGRCYTIQDQERTPHFIYELKTGEKFGILFEKAEYLQPIPRELTQHELDVLVNFLITSVDKEYKRKGVSNGWEDGVGLWNDQNYDYNNHSPSWFPMYKKIDENTNMPDYSKLND